jgi:Cu(I)/Ag(I) efflux system membrane fusion protein
LIVSLAGGDAPIEGATVSVEVWMPAMGSMPEMRSKADVTEAGGGVYRARFELSMAGSWTATVEASAGDRRVTAEYGLTVGTSGLRATGTAQTSGTGGATSTAAPAVAHSFGADGRASVLAALDAYEAIRAALAGDSMSGVAAASQLVAAALREAVAAEAGAPDAVRNHLARGADAAAALAASTSIDEARKRFSDVSEHVVALAAADPELRNGRHVFECPMWEGFSQWVQPSDALANPYMGQQMLTCGSEQPWDAATSDAPAPAHAHDPDEISHYTCPMHPWVKKSDPDDICPVCSMDLTPVTKEEIQEGVIRIDRERRQAFGVRTAKVERRQLTVPIHAVGRVAYDERRLADVTLKYKGWIERLFVEETGQRVKKGQALFEVYSPELFAAQHELILAARQQSTATTDTQRSRAEALLRGARKRMRLWDLSNAQIDAVIAAGEPSDRLTIRSPASGFVIEKHVVEGAAVDPGMRLYRIADLDRVWVEAEIYEAQIPLVRKGMTVTVSLSSVATAPVSGTVSFIHPYIDERTRTARVRIELDNKDLALKPDMFAEVDLQVEHGVTLVVPEPSIVYSGPRRVVFVDIGDDRLRPTLVEVGVKSGGYVEVLSGLKEGDTVVVSGNFLVAAESRLKSATGIW